MWQHQYLLIVLGELMRKKRDKGQIQYRYLVSKKDK